MHHHYRQQLKKAIGPTLMIATLSLATAFIYASVSAARDADAEIHQVTCYSGGAVTYSGQAKGRIDGIKTLRFTDAASGERIRTTAECVVVSAAKLPPPSLGDHK